MAAWAQVAMADKVARAVALRAHGAIRYTMLYTQAH